jgi:putative phosphoribosyl transferase
MTNQRSPKVSAEVQEVELRCGGRRLRGTLSIPGHAGSLVLLAHDSGSGRFSPRNQFVATLLHEGGLATLLFDLLDEEEAEDRDKAFDIDLLADRLQGTADWLAGQERTRNLRVGCFAASAGAAAALIAAVREPERVGVVVSRGGRPDLASQYLSAVAAPTLFIVGGDDAEVLRLNEKALELLLCPKELVVIPGATHLFPEPGALEEVARLARAWFVRHLTSCNH